MNLHASKAVLGLLAFSLGTGWAQVTNLTGTWRLNVEKSEWGQVQRPVAIIVNVVHNEPALSYSGTVIYAGGEESRSFGFEGAVDGKQHPISRSFGPGTISTVRVDRNTTTSVFRSNDGKWTENIRTTISRDGKVMRRKIERRGPEGEMNWTEVYERQ